MTTLKRKAPNLTDAEEAAIQRQIASDPDAPEATDEQIEQALPFAEAMKRRVGRPKAENPKQQVTVRLDADIIAKMRASGPGWQVRMNDVLRKNY